MTWPFAPLTPKTYRAVVIDPPWSWSGGKKGRPQHYDRMTMDNILALPVRDLLHPEGGRVFAWITPPLLDRIDDIASAWRLRFSTSMTWVKLKQNEGGLFMDRSSFAVGLGLEVRGNAEHVIILKAGRPERLGSSKFPSLLIAPRLEHSRKPEDLHEAIEARLQGPWCELFARRSRPGWDVFGNQSTKFDAPPAQVATPHQELETI